MNSDKTSTSNIKLFKVGTRPTEQDVENYKKSQVKVNKKGVDPYFIQSVIDRLLGPDGESYLEKINELNKQHRERNGKIGSELYEEQSNELIFKTVYPN